MVVASTTIIALLAAAGIAVGGTFFTSELITLLQFVTNNFFYAAIIVVAIIIALTYKNYVDSKDVSPAIAAGGAILVMALAIGAPFLTGEIANLQSSYTATFTGDVSGGGIISGEVDFEGIELKNLEKGGPAILSGAGTQASIWNTDYNIDVTVACEGEKIGSVTLSGDAPDNSEGSISGIPTRSSCVAEASMTKPDSHGGVLSDKVRFTTS